MSCRFFAQHGFCARGTNCDQLHEANGEDGRDEKEPELEVEVDAAPAMVDIVFSFDTTGSMTRWMDEVERELKTLCRDLFSEASGGQLRVGLVAHGCYQYPYDTYYSDYQTKRLPLTEDLDAMRDFLRNAGCSGGCPTANAAYDLVMHEAATEVAWRPEATTRALVLIGDECPHEQAEGRRHHPDADVHDWREELARLAAQGIVVYGVQCGHERHAHDFYEECARRTGGEHLLLTNIANIGMLFKGLCLRDADAGAFRRFHEELLHSRRVDGELRRAMERLGQNLQQRTQQQQHVASAVRRLLKDLGEVARGGAGPHVAVVPKGEDLFQWHVNVQPPQGPLAGVLVHLVLQFPRSYPARPPRARLVSWLPEEHGNVEDGHVCLGDLHEQGGWSAGYSIVNLLVCIANLVGEPGDAFEQWYASLGRRSKKATRKRMQATSCACGHLTAMPYPPLPGHEACVPLSVVLPHEPADADADAEEEGGEAHSQAAPRRVRAAPHVVVAGTVAETRARNVWGRIRSDQPFHRHHGAFAFEVRLEFFDHDGDAASEFVVGFGAADHSFVGVTSGGRLVLPHNKVAGRNVFGEEADEVVFDRDDVVTCALVLPPLAPKLQLVVGRNREVVAVVTPVSKPLARQAHFFPTFLVKNARARLLLDESPALVKFAPTLLPDGAPEEARVWAMAAIPEVRGVDLSEWARLPRRRRNALSRLRSRALTADALSVVFAHLVYEELVRCWQVCRPWREAMRRFNVLERHELRCFFTRATAAEDVLGVGVFVRYSEDRGGRPKGALPWISEARTSMDVLSLRAWEEYRVRADLLGEPMTHFLPLAIHAGHARRAEQEMRARLAAVCQQERCTAEAALYAIGAVMNQFVVQLMSATTGDEEEQGRDERRALAAKHASEKALVGYVAFHHLLLQAAELFPAMRELAGEHVAKFMADEQFRTKAHVPDLGKFLVNLAVMPDRQRRAMKWSKFWRHFAMESMDRRVKWFIRDLPHLGDAKCAPARRLADTLRATRVSRRLSTFQHWFFHHVAAPPGATQASLLRRYHDGWGRPTPELRRALLAEVRALLHGEESWADYFARLRVAVNPDELPGMLRRAVERSAKKGYHRPWVPRRPAGQARDAAPRGAFAPRRFAPAGAAPGRRSFGRRRWAPAFSSRFGEAQLSKAQQEERKVKREVRRRAQARARREQGRTATTTCFRLTGVPAWVAEPAVREFVEGAAFALGGACRVVSVRREAAAKEKKKQGAAAAAAAVDAPVALAVSSLDVAAAARLRKKLAGSALHGARLAVHRVRGDERRSP